MENSKKQEAAKTWKKLVAKAWADPEWKARLLADPVAVLREEGLNVPENVKIRIVEETPGVRTLLLPVMPEGGWDLERQDKRRAAMCDCFPFSCNCFSL